MKKIFYISLLIVNMLILYMFNSYVHKTQKLACKVLYMDNIKYYQGSYFGKVVYKVLDDTGRTVTINTGISDYYNIKVGDILVLNVKRYELIDGINPIPLFIILLLLTNFILVITIKNKQK